MTLRRSSRATKGRGPQLFSIMHASSPRRQKQLEKEEEERRQKQVEKEAKRKAREERRKRKEEKAAKKVHVIVKFVQRS